MTTRISRKLISEMFAEMAREMGVLFMVFAPLDYFLHAGPQATGEAAFEPSAIFWGFFVGGLILGISGIVVERLRAEEV